jgi:hypothetical protein
MFMMGVYTIQDSLNQSEYQNFYVLVPLPAASRGGFFFLVASSGNAR